MAGENDEALVSAKLKVFEKVISQNELSSHLTPAILRTISDSLHFSSLLKIAIKGSTAGFRLNDNHIISLTESIIKSNIQLLDLSLTYHNITDIGFEEIARLLKPGVFDHASNNLEGLDLEGNSIEGNTFSASNLASAYDCPLMYLNLSCNPLSNDGRAAIGEVVAKNRTIRQLSVNCCGFELTALISFITNLNGNSALQLLYMDRPLIGNSGTDDLLSDHISRVLQLSTCTLFDLSLRYCGIHNNGAKLLSTALTINNTLINVNLECNKIGDVGAEAIASYLLTKSSNSIKSLGLSSNLIGDDGAIALAEAIKSNTSLNNLSLKNNKIGSVGLSALCDVLEVNTTLESITLFGNSFNNANGRQFHDLIQTRLPYTGLYLDIVVYVVDGQYMIAEN